MSKSKAEAKPELDREFVETRLMEALERADKEITLTKRNKARDEAVILQGLLDASR